MNPQNCPFEQFAEYHNIRLAFLKAIRGKRSSPEVTLFCQHIDRNLETLQNRLAAGNIQWGPYHQFTITDPKERIISAVPIEDRIMHHRYRIAADNQRIRGGKPCADPAVPGKTMVWEQLGKQCLQARTG
jgi:hypothetical protein